MQNYFKWTFSSLYAKTVRKDCDQRFTGQRGWESRNRKAQNPLINQRISRSRINEGLNLWQNSFYHLLSPWVANHSRNDKMHTPPPMSNYLRGGCAKRWEALIYQGISRITGIVVSSKNDDNYFQRRIIRPTWSCVFSIFQSFRWQCDSSKPRHLPLTSLNSINNLNRRNVVFSIIYSMSQSRAC